MKTARHPNTGVAQIARRSAIKGCVVAIGPCFVVAMLSGCGYTVGNTFTRDIKTVSVPIFENATNRRGIEFQLTDAVIKQVNTRTPYRLAKGLDADTKLTGKIVSFRKDVLSETRDDDSRELQLSLMVQVTWEDLRSGKVLATQEMPLSPESIPLTTQSEFAPEIGQSLATGLDDTFQLMARKIVNLMEVPALANSTKDATETAANTPIKLVSNSVSSMR